MLHKPKLSIIVPVYKVESYLSQCIESILGQTFTDFELLLIDDGSPDNSGQICDDCADMDSRIKVYHRVNSGVSSARNFGIEEARGEWITFVDSDDWIDHEMYKYLYETTIENKVDMVLSGYYEVTDGVVREYPVKAAGGKLSENQKKQLIGRIIGVKTFRESPQMGTICTSIMRRESIRDVRFPNIRFSEDKSFLLEVLLNIDSLYVCDKIYYFYRTNMLSASKRYVPSFYIDYSKSIQSIQQILGVSKLLEYYKQEFDNSILYSFLSLFHNEKKSRESMNNSVTKIKYLYDVCEVDKILRIHRLPDLMRANPIWFLLYFKCFWISLFIYKKFQ